MIEINGVYAKAIVYTDEIEASAAGQIQALCDQPFAAGSKIRIMPDVRIEKQIRPIYNFKSSDRFTSKKKK